MNRLVIDASVAIKWVVEEVGTADALALLSHRSLTAPDLMVAECANILWKKVHRGELTAREAQLSAQIIARADIELYPMRALLEPATRLAIELAHPAYDFLYLALALANDWQFVTADLAFIAKVRASSPRIAQSVLALDAAAKA